MKVPSVRARLSGDGGYRIHPASNEDWSAIERLLTYADRQYLALEWWTIQEWLGSPTCLLISDSHNRSQGLMLAVMGDGAIAWLRIMIVASDRYLAPLLQASTEAVLAQGGTGMAFLGDEGWILPKLKQTGFRKVNQVVSLRLCERQSIQRGPLDLQVRAATAADLDAILAVDHAAFEPIWWYSRPVLVRALNIGHSFAVAYLEDECVGYQLCTLRNGRGHIVRLVVHPNWQRRGIGGRLLSEAILALDGAGARSVTVNTQGDNLASLHLYHRFNFDRTGRPWAVWFRSLESQWEPTRTTL